MAKVYLDNEKLREKHPACFRNVSAEGMQSMSQIKDLNLYKLSNQFFNIWEKSGQSSAIEWAGKNMSAEEQVAARPYIKMVFEKNGYSLGE